jgi:hypothetical protein
VAIQKIHDAASIICVGSFNPAIFHPAWLSARGLIQKTEEEGAEVKLISPEATEFKIKWLQLQVLRDRFSAATDTPDDSMLLRDLVIGSFRFLEHTPVKQVGLNRHIHFQLDNAEEWHHVGHVLAPKKIWRKYLQEPGMGALSMKDVRLNHANKGPAEVNVQINPSGTRPNTIETGLNHHFVMKEGAAASAASLLIAEHWESVMGKSLEIARGIVSDALAEKLNG